MRIKCSPQEARYATKGNVKFERTYHGDDYPWSDGVRRHPTGFLELLEATFKKDLVAPEGMELLPPGDPRRVGIKPEGTMLFDTEKWCPANNCGPWVEDSIYAIPILPEVEYRELTVDEPFPEVYWWRVRKYGSGDWSPWNRCTKGTTGMKATELFASMYQHMEFRTLASIPPPKAEKRSGQAVQVRTQFYSSETWSGIPEDIERIEWREL